MAPSVTSTLKRWRWPFRLQGKAGGHVPAMLLGFLSAAAVTLIGVLVSQSLILRPSSASAGVIRSTATQWMTTSSASAGVIRSEARQWLSTRPSSFLFPVTGEVRPDPADPAAKSFQNVLLVININYETVAMNTTMFWRRYYSRFFRHIEVICRTPIPQLGVEGASSSYPDALGMWRGTTWGFHYAALPRLMQRYPHVEGVLWTNDDVVINYWNLLGADKSKLWLPNNRSKWEYMSFDLYPKNESGKPVRRKDWGAGSAFMKQAQRALWSLPLPLQKQYNISTGGGKQYHKRVCDLFYIPQRLFPTMQETLLPAVLKAEMMSELGIPLAFLAAEHPRGWDPVLNDMEYNWELLFRVNRSYSPRDHWSPAVSAFHPWKVASLQGKLEFLLTMYHIDPTLRRLFPRYLTNDLILKDFIARLKGKLKDFLAWLNRLWP